jgi:hypothetical protein
MFQKLALLKLAASSPVSPSLLDVDPRALETLRFTPEGKAVAYVIYDQGVDNILVEPWTAQEGSKLRASPPHESPDSLGHPTADPWLLRARKEPRTLFSSMITTLLRSNAGLYSQHRALGHPHPEAS